VAWPVVVDGGRPMNADCSAASLSRPDDRSAPKETEHFGQVATQ